jgi:predicted nucleotide-binding protein (sugar kinase/HSP70/actin superfamily)
VKPGRKPSRKQSAVPLHPGERRLIVSTCEKGAVEAVDDMRQVQKGLDAIKKANPNLVEVAARQAFEPVEVDDVSDSPPRSWALTPARRRRAEQIEGRPELRIGIPRILNLYSHAPFFLGYFQSLGIPAKHIVFSDYTSEEQYKRGAKRGAIDPCFPTKVGIPHVHELLERHRKKRLTHMFIPMVDSFPTHVDGVLASRACPALVASVEATYAAFIKEGNVFEENGIRFRKTFLNLDEPLLCARQMHEDWQEDLGTTLAESHRAVEQGLRALSAFYAELRRRGREVLDELEREDRIGVVVLSRPYHNDPGLNHGVCEALQKLGYPVLSQDSLPRDCLLGADLAKALGREVRGPAPEPGRARALELQVRPRCTHLLDHRGDRGALRDAVLLLQGHRREPPGGRDQDPHRDDRLLPEPLPRGAGPAAQRGGRALEGRL